MGLCGVWRLVAAGDGEGWKDDPTEGAGVARGGEWVERADSDCGVGEYDLVVRSS